MTFTEVARQQLEAAQGFFTYLICWGYLLTWFVGCLLSLATLGIPSLGAHCFAGALRGWVQQPSLIRPGL